MVTQEPYDGNPEGYKITISTNVINYFKMLFLDFGRGERKSPPKYIRDFFNSLPEDLSDDTISEIVETIGNQSFLGQMFSNKEIHGYSNDDYEKLYESIYKEDEKMKKLWVDYITKIISISRSGSFSRILDGVKNWILNLLDYLKIGS